MKGIERKGLANQCNDHRNGYDRHSISSFRMHTLNSSMYRIETKPTTKA